MDDLSAFKEWLSKNTDYSHEVIIDLCSRVKRADSILPWYQDEVYIFYLERSKEFCSLSCSVRSQIKKAVKLYSEYKREG